LLRTNPHLAVLLHVTEPPNLVYPNPDCIIGSLSVFTDYTDPNNPAFDTRQIANQTGTVLQTVVNDVVLTRPG
jgi:hypothetical protein